MRSAVKMLPMSSLMYQGIRLVDIWRGSLCRRIGRHSDKSKYCLKAATGACPQGGYMSL